jgi:predicted RNA-binding protein Jag
MNELVEKFFRGLGIQISALDIESQDDDVHIQIETSDSPLIIGMHGKNLEVFQHLL